MKFSVNKIELEKAMNQIDAIVPGRDTQTLLSNVLLSVSQSKKLRITASDMESTVRITLDAEETVSGELIIKAKKLYEIAKQINADTVLFDAEINEDSSKDEEKSYRVKVDGVGGRAARFKMTGSDRSHFPEINEISNEKMFQIPSELLGEMIARTFHSISHEDNRYIYNGICFHIEGNKLTLIGTDGRRLSAITRELPSVINLGGAEGDIVVHAKAIRELQKIMELDEFVYIGVEQRDIFFKVGNAELSSRLLEGKFPDYKKVIPVEFLISMEIERSVLLDSIKQVMVMTEQPSFQVKMSMGKEGTFLTANTPEMGEAELELPVKSTTDNLEIGFNANYFQDILRSIQCNKIKLQFNDPTKPIVFADLDDDKFVALVMPMKI
ncbi:MAG: DNA polymerase III subunit beta [Spirochaetia bacterium]|nr:DNA polymerase III subunit beta [Spirochaetia bacterium]